MAKSFSPAPWKIQPYDRWDKRIVIEVSKTRDRIFVDIDDADFKQQEANARLIVAAPELYEAVEAARDFMNDLDDREKFTDAAAELSEILDRVLQKAKGT